MNTSPPTSGSGFSTASSGTYSSSRKNWGRSSLSFVGTTGKNLRKEEYRDYKGNREDDEQKQKLRKTVEELKFDVLPSFGYKNIIFQEGYEADDVIASICKHNTDDQLVIVTEDKDLYQLLRSGVTIYNPRKRGVVNQASFQADYKIRPLDWPMVKAIAGCSTDNIDGIPGIGEVKALEYVIGISKDSVTDKVIQDIKLVKRNLRLIKLPFPGTKVFPLLKDEINHEQWNNGVTALGFKSLLGFQPRRRRMLDG
jgi:5'-3' exonuclease